MPELVNDEARFIYQLYIYLHTQRGDKLKPISISDIAALFNIYNVDEYERCIYMDFIIKLDEIWLKFAAEEARKNSK